MFEWSIPVAESGILLPFPAGLHAFVADVGIFSVSQGCQLDFKEAYFSYHRRQEMFWEHVASVGWFLYVSSTREVLDIPVYAITTGKRTVNNVHVTKWVEAVSFAFTPGRPKRVGGAD